MEQLQKTHCLAVFWTALDSGSRFSSLFLFSTQGKDVEQNTWQSNANCLLFGFIK